MEITPILSAPIPLSSPHLPHSTREFGGGSWSARVLSSGGTLLRLALVGLGAGLGARGFARRLQPFSKQTIHGADEMADFVRAFLNDNVGAGVRFIQP